MWTKLVKVAASVLALVGCSSRGRQAEGERIDTRSAENAGYAQGAPDDPWRLPDWVVRPPMPDAGPPGLRCKVTITDAKYVSVEASGEGTAGETPAGQPVYCTYYHEREPAKAMACERAYRAACAKLPPEEDCTRWGLYGGQDAERVDADTVRVKVSLLPERNPRFEAIGTGDSEETACRAADRRACQDAGQREDCVATARFSRQHADFPHDEPDAPMGLQLVCPANRQLHEEGSNAYCRDGDVNDGPFLMRDPRGRVDRPGLVGTYRNGKKHGLWQNYQEGVLIGQVMFDDGLQEGRSFAWWQTTGKLEHVGSYRRGEPDGLWVSYDEDGQQAGSATYLNGVLIRSTGRHVDTFHGPRWQDD